MTQKERVEKRLLELGYISRNECLRNYISRLSGIIKKLEYEGWTFTTKATGNDYYYFLATAPVKKVVYKVGEKEIITYKK